MTHRNRYAKKILVLLAVATCSLALLFSQSYPDLSEGVAEAEPAPATLDPGEVKAFLAQWQAGELTFSSFARDLKKRIGDRNPDLQQLASIRRIQTRQLEQLKLQAKPVFALFSDQTNPLYSYSIAEDTFGGTGTTRSHRIGLGASITQSLPTAGSLSLTLKEGSTVSIGENETEWTWTHSPSVGISFRQPLGLGEGLVDRSYADRQLERQVLEESGAGDALENATLQLVLQGSQLLATRQSLSESRWLAIRQRDLVEEELSDTLSDLEGGLVSKNDAERKAYARDRLQLTVSELSSQIETIESSLLRLYGPSFSAIPLSFAVSEENLYRMLSYAGTGILDDRLLYEQVLQVDPAYRDAMRSKRIAQIDRILSSPADSPVFSVDMQLSPYYDTAEGNGFLGSVGDLLTTSEPVLSVTVNFSASDLQRRSSALARDLAGESLSQAVSQIRSAMEGVEDKLGDLQRRLNDQVRTLGLALADYRIKANDVEVERILASMGLGDESSIRVRENLNYEAAFAVLQSLRSLDLLSLELDAMTGSIT